MTRAFLRRARQESLGVERLRMLPEFGSAVREAEPTYGFTNLQQLVAFDSATRTVTSTVSLQGFSVA